MGRVLVFLVLILGLMGCGQKPQSNNNNEESAEIKVVGGKQAVAIIKDNKLDFYDIEKDELVLQSKNSFTIPKDNNGLFFLDTYTIGVVIRNEVNFYKNENNGWHLSPDEHLTIPKDIDKIFGFGEYDWKSICILKNDEVTFYRQGDKGNWVKKDKKTLKLMDSVDNVFGLGNLSIGVVKNNSVYLYNDLEDHGNWELDPNPQISIPKGTDVIGFGQAIGLANNHHLDLYVFNPVGHKWVKNSNLGIDINDIVGQ